MIPYHAMPEKLVGGCGDAGHADFLGVAAANPSDHKRGASISQRNITGAACAFQLDTVGKQTAALNLGALPNGH